MTCFFAAGDLGEFDVGVTQMQRRQLVQTVAVRSAFQDVGKEHRVVDGCDLDAVSRHHLHVVFDVVADLQDAGVFQHRFQHLDRAVARNLFRRFARAAAVAEVKLAVAIAVRRHMRDRHIAGAAALHRQRQTDQIRLHGIERIGFRIEGYDAGFLDLVYPGLQGVFILHQLVGAVPGRGLGIRS